VLDQIATPAHPDLLRRAAVLPDHYLLGREDADLVAHLLGDQNFSFAFKDDGRPLTWGAFGTSFQTLGELRNLAADHPPEDADEPESETVGLELFGNMLDTIAFLRVRLRTLADVCIEKGLVSGPELLTRYHESHERSFEAFRDLMLLRPEVFEERFAQWLATERNYRERLEGDAIATEPATVRTSS
jgi:hypothetical protein